MHRVQGTLLQFPEPVGPLAVRHATPMKTILVVDDDENMRELLKLHLSNAGYAVRTAEDALVAGRIILSCDVDLLIADVHMPHMSGFELVSAMIGDKSVRRMPVIFLSADENADQDAKLLGAAYVHKPVRADQLLSAIRQALDAPAV